MTRELCLRYVTPHRGPPRLHPRSKLERNRGGVHHPVTIRAEKLIEGTVRQGQRPGQNNSA